MTAAFDPHRQWFAEDMRDAALDSLAEALDELRILQDKQSSLPFGDDLLTLELHRATAKALAFAQITVRRHHLAS